MKQLMRTIADSLYKWPIKPLLFARPPDAVHEGMVRLGWFTQKLPLVNRLMHASLSHADSTMLAQHVFGLTFENPVGLSAGLDKNAQLPPTMRAVGFGFATVGSITAEAADGNPKPWYYRLPNSKSLVVNAGLPNEGADVIGERIASYRGDLFEHFPLVANLAKTNSPKTNTDEAGVADYIAGLSALQHNPHIAMFEINVSCPNTFGGEPFTRPEPLEALLAKIDDLNLLQPVTVKMPINLTWDKFDELLQVIVKHKVVAVTIGNLQKNRKAVELKDKLPDTVPGNLSGKPTFDMCNELIAKTYAAYGEKLTIIGLGGIFSAEDTYEKIKRGATLVELVTGVIFTGPQLIGQINHDLVALLKRDGYANISEAIGANHRL